MREFAEGVIPSAAVRAKIDEVLARPEFHRETPFFGRWLEDFRSWLERRLSQFFGIGLDAAGTLLEVLVYVALALALAWLVWRIVSLRRARDEHTAAHEPETDPHVLRRRRVADLRRRARTARTDGDHVLALRLYFTALVVGLGERGDLEYRDAWTNRELLERGEPKPIAERVLAPLVPTLDRKSFGGEIATDDDVRDLALVVDELLGAEAT